MKKTLLLAAALACSSTVAQEKEIWACQQTKGAVLAYENGSWEILGRVSSNILLTLDGSSSQLKIEDETISLSCSNIYQERFGCFDLDIGTEYFLLDRANGNAGYSFLGGAMNRRDGVATAIYNCTKF